MQGSASRERDKKHHFSMRWITFSPQRAGKQFRKAGRHHQRSSETVPAASICGWSRVDGRTVTYGCAQPIEQALVFRYRARRRSGLQTSRPGSENSRWQAGVRARSAGAFAPTAWYDCYGLSPGRPTLSANAARMADSSLDSSLAACARPRPGRTNVASCPEAWGVTHWSRETESHLV